MKLKTEDERKLIPPEGEMGQKRVPPQPVRRRMIVECTECSGETPTVYEYDGDRLVKVTFSKAGLCDECEAFVRGARFVQGVVAMAPSGEDRICQAVEDCLAEVD